MTKSLDITDDTRPPLSWRQRAFWIGMMCQDPGKPTPRWKLTTLSILVPSSVPKERIQGALSEMVVRHESLRTKLAMDSSGRLKQDLQSEIEVPLEISNIASNESTYSREVAENLIFDMLMEIDFDLYADIPIRAGMAKLSRRHNLLVVVIHHIAVDGWSLRILKDDLEGLLSDYPPRTERTLASSSKTQISDIAREQNSITGQQEEANALAYIESCLLQCPKSILLTQPQDTSEDAHCRRAHLASTKLTSAVASIARTYRTTAPSVMLGLFIAALSSYSKQNRCCVNMLVSNRWQAGTKQLVASLANSVPVYFDLMHCQYMSDLIRLSFRNSLEAMRRGAFPLEKLELIRRQVEHKRGIRFQTQPIFSYVIPPEGAARGFNPVEGVDDRAYVEDIEPTELASPLEFAADEESGIFIGAECKILKDVKGFAMAIERLATHLASGRDPELGDVSEIAGFEYPTLQDNSLVLYDNSWINLRDIEQLIGTHPAVRDAMVRLSDDGSGHQQELVAYITPSSDIVATDLRDYLFQRLHKWPFAVVPARFAGIQEYSNARKNPPRYLGLLIEIINQLHGYEVANGQMSYLLMGADVELIPSVIAELRHRGLVGLEFIDLYSEFSLLDLAGRLQTYEI